MQIGDINVTDSILNLEGQVEVLGKIIDYLLNNNPSLNKPTPADLDRYRQEALANLQKKYPNMGVNAK